MSLHLRVDVQFAARRPWAPTSRQLRSWVAAAVGHAPRGCVPGARRASALPLVVSVQIVGLCAGRALNARFRGQDAATNVLSFAGPGRGPAGGAWGEHILGELVICAPVLAREARAQRKTLRAHWAHIVVHGCLHLLGFDHRRPDQALVMEALETQIIESMGFSNPYG